MKLVSVSVVFQEGD